MINIKQNTLSLIIFLSLFGCIDPNNDDLWSISIDATLETNGFARDISMNGNNAIVAAGQYGIQVWDLDGQSMVAGFTGYEEGGTFLEFSDVALVDVDPDNDLILASESNDDVKIFHYGGGDSLFYRNTVMSARTKDFVSFYTKPGQFVMYSADNDDGMKWHYYNLDTTSSFGIEFIEWTPYGGSEIYTPGKPLGIDSDGSNYIAMAVDQLGVELFYIDSLGATPVLINRVDTEGNAEKVALTAEGVFVACDDAGALYVPIDSFSSESVSYRFAEDLTVDHISIKGSTACLTLGSKGIALYDVSDPTGPKEKGIFPVGYSYTSIFWGDKLLVCTREGLQIITIEQ